MPITRTQLNNDLISVLTPIIDVPQHHQANGMILDYIDQQIGSVTGDTWTAVSGNYYTKTQINTLISAGSTNQLTIADIQGLQLELDKRSLTGHTHNFNDIDGLQEALDGKQDILFFANGLTATTGGTVGLGGTIDRATTLNVESYPININSTNAPNEVLSISNSSLSDSYALKVSGTNNANGAMIETVSKNALYVKSASGVPINVEGQYTGLRVTTTGDGANPLAAYMYPSTDAGNIYDGLKLWRYAKQGVLPTDGAGVQISFSLPTTSADGSGWGTSFMGAIGMSGRNLATDDYNLRMSDMFFKVNGGDFMTLMGEGDLYLWKYGASKTSAGQGTRFLGVNGAGKVEIYDAPSSAPTTPTLTSTQIAFGNGSNLMTSSSGFTWNDGLRQLKIGTGVGSPRLFINGLSAAFLQFQSASITRFILGHSGETFSLTNVNSSGTSLGTSLEVNNATSAVRFTKYGVGNITGTATRQLAVDGSGNVIEVPLSSGGSTGTLQQVTTAGNTTTDDIEITDATKGIIMKSPNGNRWRITIGDDGALTSTAL